MKPNSISKDETVSSANGRIGSDRPAAHENSNSQSAKDEKTLEKALRDLKIDFKTELAALKRKFDEQLKSEREFHNKTHEKQRLMFQKEQEAIVKNRLKEAVQNYSDLVADQRKELEKVRQMHNEYDTTMRKKDEEIVQLKIELAKSSADLQTRKIVMQLAERNATIERLQSRIGELEDIVSQYGSENEDTEGYGEDEPIANYHRGQRPDLIGKTADFQAQQKSRANEGHLNFGDNLGEGPEDNAPPRRLSGVRPVEGDNGQEDNPEEPYDVDAFLETRQRYAPSQARPSRSSEI